MRVWALILMIAVATHGQAEPGPQCSQGRYGHAFCIRPAHFVFDLCHTLYGESRRHGLAPGFFARLIWQESRFDPNAVSPADAMGIAQFIASTARLRGLDNPFNPGEALEASARYLALLTQEFGNPGLAAVAYNGGETRAARFLARQGGLPKETVDYVRIITGLPAETWRDAPPAAPDFRLDPAEDFLPACFALAAKRRISPPVQPQPDTLPWGVQIGFGRSETSARAAANRNTTRCKALVQKENIDFLKIPNRVSGKPGYVMARIGRTDKTMAAKLCQSLARSGCRCRVYRN